MVFRRDKWTLGAHVLSLSPTWSTYGEAMFSATSRRLSSNIEMSGAATLVFPPFASGELDHHSLIVDTSALMTDSDTGNLRCRPTTPFGIDRHHQQ